MLLKLYKRSKIARWGISKLHEAICSVSGKPPYCEQCGAKMVSVPGLGVSSWCCEKGCDDKYTDDDKCILVVGDGSFPDCEAGND